MTISYITKFHRFPSFASMIYLVLFQFLNSLALKNFLFKKSPYFRFQKNFKKRKEKNSQLFVLHHPPSYPIYITTTIWFIGTVTLKDNKVWASTQLSHLYHNNKVRASTQEKLYYTFGEQVIWSIILVKDFYLFKITESVFSFYLKLYNFKQMRVFYQNSGPHHLSS